MKINQREGGFGKTTSGTMNRHVKDLHQKQITIDDQGIDMLSKQFLSTKTLKKPLLEYDPSLVKTITNGIKHPFATSANGGESASFSVTAKRIESNKQSETVTFISGLEKTVLPAYRQTLNEPSTLQPLRDNFLKTNDTNTIMSAFLKKGIKPEIPPSINIIAAKPANANAGPAENRLKNLFGRKEQLKRKAKETEISEEIHESIEEEYADSFEKLSKENESAVKESIRESLGGLSVSKAKDSLRVSMKSVTEEITEEIMMSHQQSKESIQEIYEEVFEDESLSNSLNKSQSKLRKSGNFRESQSASKSFRIIKSIKLAEEMTRKASEGEVKKPELSQKLIKDIESEQAHIARLKKNIANVLSSQPKSSQVNPQNKDLLYRFQIEINRLLVSDVFESKLKKLTSFLGNDEPMNPPSQRINQLEDKILQNIQASLQALKAKSETQGYVIRIKEDHKRVMEEQLRIQQIKLKAEFLDQLSAKDLELRKMMAEMEQRLLSQGGNRRGFNRDQFFARQPTEEADSDCSIDSADVSWQADLWQLLPGADKRKLYEKQTSEVTKFLTNIMLQELKDEALERSLDISFQFPEDLNVNEPNSSRNNSSRDSSRNTLNDSSSFSAQEKAPVVAQFSKSTKQSLLGELPHLPTAKHVSPSEDLQTKAFGYEDEYDPVSITRNTKRKGQVLRILSGYKSQYLRKKNDTIKKLVQMLSVKECPSQSSLHELKILLDKEVSKDHLPYIRAYEQSLLWNLVGVFSKAKTKKSTQVEEQLKNAYDRLLIVSQVQAAENCVQTVAIDAYQSKDYASLCTGKLSQKMNRMERKVCPIEQGPNEQYIGLKERKETDGVKQSISQMIMNVLTAEFARQFPSNK